VGDSSAASTVVESLENGRETALTAQVCRRIGDGERRIA